MKTFLLAVALFAAVACAAPKNKRDVSEQQTYLPPSQDEGYHYDPPEPSLQLSSIEDVLANPEEESESASAPVTPYETPLEKQASAPQARTTEIQYIPAPEPQQTNGAPVVRQSVDYNQQQVGSNGGYVY